MKLYLEKVYDRLEWKLIKETLEVAGLPSLLISVIMKIISSGLC